MRQTDLMFHIARKSGLEFVFSAGPARSYPLHTHVSVFTVTLLRKGFVSLARPSGISVYQPGSVYVDAPNEPHSPTYGDNHDLVSLCLDKRHFVAAASPEILPVCLACARPLAEQGLLSAEDVESLMAGVRAVRQIKTQSACAAKPDEPARPGVLTTELDERVRRGLSPFHYLRRFKKETGLTPHQYLIQQRLRQAKTMLAPGCSIADIACRSGFYDQSHLNRWFMKNIGLTPKEYLNSRRYLD